MCVYVAFDNARDRFVAVMVLTILTVCFRVVFYIRTYDTYMHWQRISFYDRKECILFIIYLYILLCLGFSLHIICAEGLERTYKKMQWCRYRIFMYVTFHYPAVKLGELTLNCPVLYANFCTQIYDSATTFAEE